MSSGQNISTRLLALRAKHGLTQTELAAALGVSLSYIHQLESGKRTEPSPLFISVIDLWERLNALTQSSPDASEKIQEEGTGYHAPMLRFPVSDDLSKRVASLAQQSGLSADTLINAAVEAFVSQCEESHSVQIPLSAKTKKESKGAA